MTPDPGRAIASVEVFQVPPRWYLVRLACADGTTGWGEAIVPKRPAAVTGAISDLAANIRGEDANWIEDLWQRMHRGAFFRGGPVLATAAAAIEQALWDIKGRRYGLPVHEFLGGAVRERVRAYAWVGGDTPADVVEHTARRIEQGMTAVKMNVAGQLDGLAPREAIDGVVERVASLRERFGRALGIAVDFHGRANHVVARALLRELEQFALMWVEEPVPPESDDALKELRAVAGATPIATGERLTSRWQFRQLLADHAVDVLQPDVSLTGLFELEKICRMAEAHDVFVAPHCPNGPVSLAASLQVGMCCPNVVIQEQSGGLHYNQGYQGLRPGELGDYLTDPAPVLAADGHFARGSEPGLGISIDTEAVTGRAYQWELRDPVWRYSDGRLAEW